MFKKLKVLIFVITFVILSNCDEIQEHQPEADDKATLIYWPPNWGRPNWTRPFFPFYILKNNRDEDQESKVDENSSVNKREINFDDPKDVEIDEKKSSFHIPNWWYKFNHTRPVLPRISTLTKREVIADDSQLNEQKSKIYWPWLYQNSIDLTKREANDNTENSDVQIKEKIYWPYKENPLPNIPFYKFKRETAKDDELEAENPLTLEDLEIEEVSKWWKKFLPKKPIHVDPFAIYNGISTLRKRETTEIEPAVDEKNAEIDEKGILWPGNWWRPWNPLRPILVGKREAVDGKKKKRNKKNRRPARQVIIIIRKQDEAVKK